MSVDADTWRGARGLFDSACELPPDEAEALLASSDHSDAVIALARRLLRAERAGGLATDEFLRRAGSVSRRVTDEGICGQSVGPYRIERLIGIGGMGSVFLARREDGEFDSEVAIKFMVEGGSVARFDAEKRALARLASPGIARILDGGTHAEWGPYLVMEYVDGVPIDEYCTAHARGARAVLRLLTRVVDEVAHAHAQLVLHRDIKPSNVMVTSDGRPVVLDFGLASILDRPLSMAATASRVFTPRYASPQQLAGEPLGVTSDIYSLAVMLYELLSGQHPFAGSYDQDAATLMRRTLEGDQMPLRRALGGSGACRMDISRTALRDLEAVLQQALARDPARGYQSADAFADELRRILEERPVHARRSSRSSRAVRTIKRNWPLAAATALATASLLVGTIVALGFARESNQQRQLAELARTRAEAMQQFLVGVLASADPLDGSNRGRDLDTLLREGVERAGSDFAAQPLAAAQLLMDMGEILMNRSRYQDADHAFRQAIELRSAELGALHRGTLAARLRHSAALQALERKQEARKELDELLQSTQQRFGDSLALVEVMSRWGYLTSVQGEHDVSEQTLRRALAIEATLPSQVDAALTPVSRAELRADLNVGLGTALMRAKRYTEAEAFVTTGLAMRSSLFGDDDPRTLEQRQNRAVLLRYLHRPEESAALQQQVMRAQRRLFDGPHLNIAYSLGHLANLRSDQQDYAGAAQLWTQAEHESRAAVGDDHPWVGTTQLMQARSLLLGGELQQARVLLEPLSKATERLDDVPQRALDMLQGIDAGPVQ